MALRGGRYAGTDGALRLELRVDHGVGSPASLVSGDLFEAVPGGPEAYVASLVSDPFDVSTSTAADGSLTLAVTPSPDDRYAAGRLVLRPVDPETLQAEATLEAVGGGPDTSWTGSASRMGEALRRVRLHSYRLQGTVAPDDPSLPAVRAPNGGAEPPPVVTVHGALRDAGLEPEAAVPVSFGPAGAGADERWSDAELRAALAGLIQDPDAAPADPWPLHLLVVDRGDRPFATGATFHFDELPGVRASVLFHDTIRDIPQVTGRPDAFAREYLFTAVHELGHQLRLPHAWEPFGGVGPPERADGALTFMNYPHLFPRGYTRFYRRFPFTFREEELLHLRHAPWERIWPGPGAPEIDEDAVDLLEWRPGGTSRDERRASPDQRGGGSLYSRRHPHLALRLRTAGPPRFAFTEPVHVEAKLENIGTRRVRVPGDVLALEAGLRVYVSEAGAREPPRRVAPLVEQQDRGPTRVLGVRGRGSGEPTYALYADLDLTFGRSGFPFGEPGAYRIHAVAELPDGRIVRAEPLAIAIAAPAKSEEPRLSDLRAPELGRTLLLGGDPAGPGVARLREIAEAGAPARLAPWAALRVGEAEGRGFKRPKVGGLPTGAGGVQRAGSPSATGTAADPETGAEWLARAEALAAEARPLPNIIRSRLLRTRAACHARAGWAQGAERDLRALERFIARVVDSNDRLRATLLREARRGRAPAGAPAAGGGTRGGIGGTVDR